MKRFLVNFCGMLVACAVLLVTVLLLYTAASRLSYILSSKETSVNTTDRKKDLIVILDAGHGGIDGGAIGVTGVLEKEINLAIVKKVEALLKEKGFSVVLTREDDTLLDDGKEGGRKVKDLRARVAKVNASRNAILISVHQNRFPDRSVSGMTFYYSQNHPDSYRLSTTLHQKMLESLQPENRRVMKEATDGIYLLYHTGLPAVMVECGFVSNPLEEAKLASEDYQNAIAAMIADGVIRYAEQSEVAK